MDKYSQHASVYVTAPTCLLIAFGVATYPRYLSKYILKIQFSVEVNSFSLCVCVCVSPLHFTVLKFEGKAKLRGEPKIEANRDRPCSIECRVMSTTLLKYPPRVNWYKDKLFTLTNESLSEYVPVISPYWQSRQHYPRAKCVQQPGIVPRYNCDLNFEYCDAERWGRYRCNVTDIEDGQTISATLRLTSTGMCNVHVCSNDCANY